MTHQNQIKALAELDGWLLQESKTHPAWNLWHKGEDQRSNETLPNYLTSYDAIIPLVRKQSEEFINAMGIELRELPWNWNTIIHTPQQLAEALLRATGKWKE